jgi:regulator of chromosome condensation
MEKFVAVAAGNNHIIVMTTHGNVYTWGAGEQGQLGRKVIERRKIHGTVPERVILGTRSRKAIVIGAGNYTSFAVDDQGDVWGWGLNTMGQTGTGIPNAKLDHTEVHLPKRVIGLSRHELNGESVVEIAGGEHHTVFLTSGGRVFAVGRSDYGQLGLPEDDPAFEDREFPDYLATPVHVPFTEHDDPVRHIAVGTHFNMAVTEGGALYAWGQGEQSELGLGADEDKAETPTTVVRRVGPFAACDVACGGQHALALLGKKTAT